MAVTGNTAKPILYFPAQPGWEHWLLDNGASSPGVRLQLAKKASVLPGMSYAEALDVALCFGWIDGQVGALDDNFFLQSFTPRRPRSTWSQINCEHVARLIATGRMRPAGLVQVEAAKSDGRWDAAYRQKDAPLPNDLSQALAANPTAAVFFSKLSSQNRFAIIFRTTTAKKAETRAARIAGFVAMLERGETIYPQNGPRADARPTE